eukprot:6472046-Amphidinium_carterae.1
MAPTDTSSDGDDPAVPPASDGPATGIDTDTSAHAAHALDTPGQASHRHLAGLSPQVNPTGTQGSDTHTLNAHLPEGDATFAASATWDLPEDTLLTSLVTLGQSGSSSSSLCSNASVATNPASPQLVGLHRPTLAATGRLIGGSHAAHGSHSDMPAHTPISMEIDSDSCPLTSLLAGERLGEARHPGPPPQRLKEHWLGHPFRKAYQPRQFLLTTSNIGGWSTGAEQIRYWSSSDDGPDIVFLQEHRLLTEALSSASGTMRAAGYKSCWTPANYTDCDSSSCGTAILTRPSFPMHQIEGPSHPSLVGRVTAAVLQAGLKPGILCVSVYLTVQSSLSAKRTQLGALADWLNQQTLPFVLGGDFNIDYVELMQMQWAELVRGAICSPDFQTVPSGKRIDYFVMSHSLLGKYGGVTRQPRCITKPHTAVRLMLYGRSEQDYVWRRRVRD